MSRHLRKPIKYTLYTIGAAALVAHYCWYTNDLHDRQVKHQDHLIIAAKAIETPVQLKTTEILVTNYYFGDGSSGKVTASGKKISDFQINDQGMYTYNGMIVIATANQNRLDREMKDGYVSHDLYEILDLEIDGTSYSAIVLDVCGSCYGVEGEAKQRIDVYTTGNVIGKVDGKVHEVHIQN